LHTFIYLKNGSHGNVISTVTRLEAGHQTNHNWISGKDKIFISSPKHLYWCWDPRRA